MLIGVQLGHLALGDGDGFAGDVAGAADFRRLRHRPAVGIGYLGRSILVEMVVNRFYFAAILCASLRSCVSVASGLALMNATI